MKLSEGVLTSCMAICARYIISSCFLIQICRTHTSKKYMHKIIEIIQAILRPYRAVFHIGIFLGKSRLEVSKKKRKKSKTRKEWQYIPCTFGTEMRTPRAGECQGIERSKGERLRDISGANVFSVGWHFATYENIRERPGDEYVSWRAAFIDHCRLSRRELNAKRISRRELL